MTISRDNFLHRCKNLLLSENLSVVLVGAGNVSWHLAKAISGTGIKLKQVVSRSYENALEVAALAQGALATSSLDLSSCHAELVILAVPYAALEQVIAQLQLPKNACVAHTSGSLPLEVLTEKFGNRAGVFYPLQTFSKGAETKFNKVPILLEAGDQKTFCLLEEVAHKLSRKVVAIDSEKRKQLHLAAVFACNFTNHLLGISRELLEIANLDTTLLQPLIEETIHKALVNPPFEVQTGPAARGDKEVINRHLLMLQQHPADQELYDLLRMSIEQ